MNDDAITPGNRLGNSILLAAGADKNTANRLSQYVRWLDQTGRHWDAPDLAAYRDYLLTRTELHGEHADPLSPSSAAAHLSSIRSQYRAILHDTATRDTLYQQARERADPEAGPERLEALVDDALERLQHELDSDRARVSVTPIPDHADSEHLRLTRQQVHELTRAPGIDTLKGKRDTAIIVLLLATGVGEGELAALQVEDLRQRLNGALALRIRQGKGNKQRLIPYGSQEWALVYVDLWLKAAGIQAGPVFRGFKAAIGRDNPRGNLQDRPITERAIQLILASYPITIEGEKRAVKPHDLRRTYARLLYDAGVKPAAIQQNLGHASLATTLGYIGELDGETRQPPMVFEEPYKAQELMKQANLPG